MYQPEHDEYEYRDDVGKLARYLQIMLMYIFWLQATIGH